MSDWKEFTGKTVEEAISNACIGLGTYSENIDYEVIEKGSQGLFGLGSKPAVIKATKKEVSDVDVAYGEATESTETTAKVEEVSEAATESTPIATVDEESKKRVLTGVTIDEVEAEKRAKAFLEEVFKAMNTNITMEFSYSAEEEALNINLVGDEMGILIGKRGGTLDSIQYLTGLVVNKNIDNYIKIKVDTENYRERRKATLENLAKNLAQKVKRTRRPVFLEPMNPYERRIIHYSLQNDEYVETHSEGEEPYRKVVITLKPGAKFDNDRYGKRKYGNRGRSYGNRNGGYKKNNNRRNYNKNYRNNNNNNNNN